MQQRIGRTWTTRNRAIGHTHTHTHTHMSRLFHQHQMFIKGGRNHDSPVMPTCARCCAGNRRGGGGGRNRRSHDVSEDEKRTAKAQHWSLKQIHAGLAIAPSQRFGSFAHVAILEPRCPCQIQVLSQKLTGGNPGRWRQVGRCPPKSAQFWAKNSHFSPKIAPKPGRNAQTKENGG